MSDMQLIEEMLDPFLTAHEARQCVPSQKTTRETLSETQRILKRPGANKAGRELPANESRLTRNGTLRAGMN